MITLLKPPEPDVQTHPFWCEQESAQCVGAEYPIHHMRETVWTALTDEVEFRVTLERCDEVFQGEQVNGAPTVLLSMLNFAAEEPNGPSPAFADARLSAEDVDILITFLQRYAGYLRHPNQYDLGPLKEPAEARQARQS